MHTTFNIRLSDNENRVLSALSQLLKSYTDETHISTKDISYESKLSIYQTRYVLIKLAEMGIVQEFGSKPKFRKSWAICSKQESLQ